MSAALSGVWSSRWLLLFVCLVLLSRVEASSSRRSTATRCSSSSSNSVTGLGQSPSGSSSSSSSSGDVQEPMDWEAIRAEALDSASTRRWQTVLRGSGESRKSGNTNSKKKILIIDVDSTLYPASCKVEKGVVKGIHQWGLKNFGLSPEECDALHRECGSTIEALQQTGKIPPGSPLLQDFYDQVYQGVDLSALLHKSSSSSSGSSIGGGGGGESDGDSTGYRHSPPAWLHLLEALPSEAKCLASNSPLRHVKRVLAALGLAHVQWGHILTPDTRGGLTKADPSFYDPITSAYPEAEFALLDDSKHNLMVGEEAGLTGTLITEAFPLERGLAAALGAIPAPEQWEFSELEYLRSKNEVDAVSRNSAVWQRLEQEVLASTQGEGDECLRVLDLGAGLLAMLEPVAALQGAFSRIEYVAFEKEGNIAAAAEERLLRDLGFTAVTAVGDTAPEWMHENDRIGETHRDGRGAGRGVVKSYRRDGDVETRRPEILVHVRQESFLDVSGSSGLFRQEEQLVIQKQQQQQQLQAEEEDSGEAPSVSATTRPLQPEGGASYFDADAYRRPAGVSPTAVPPPRLPPHLIIGCCLADLFDPCVFAAAVERLACESGCLLYLPITFQGKTTLHPSVGPCLAAEAATASAAALGDEDTTIAAAAAAAVGDTAPTGASSSVTEGDHRIPADVEVMSHYHRSLREGEGHNLDSDTLVRAIEAHGGDVIEQGSSNWHVSASKHQRLWESLLFFFGMGAAPLVAMEGEGKEGSLRRGERPPSVLSASAGTVRNDIRGWVERTRKNKPDIEIDNVDILARTFKPPAGRSGWTAAGGRPAKESGGEETPTGTETGFPTSTAAATAVEARGGQGQGQGQGVGASVGQGEGEGEGGQERSARVLEFTAPRKVHVVEEVVSAAEVGPQQLLVEAVCSSISSGTELKVFRGDFEAGAQLDTTIEGMAEDVMEYPLRYGYSLVGRVVECGSAVQDPDQYTGRLVFTFSPHASRLVVDESAVMLVPEGISARDAVYLPAVETALALVQDANPVVGEDVAVIGQGMIGLLVTAILAQTHGRAGGGSVTAVDKLPSRLEAAQSVGATHCLPPERLSEVAPLDTVVEVSGSARGLQTALDHTGFGGQVVIGSWYSAAAAPLALGTAFHRSHLRLKASQVSVIPAALSARWSKARRFERTWSLVRLLRPSDLLTTLTLPLEEAQEGYAALEAGSEVGVCLSYGGDGNDHHTHK